MCTDKWRNLLKEFKKAKENSNNNGVNCNGYSAGSNKMQFYKEVEEIIRDRNKNSKVDSFMQFSDKGITFFYFRSCLVWPIFVVFRCDIVKLCNGLDLSVNGVIVYRYGE